MLQKDRDFRDLLRLSIAAKMVGRGVESPKEGEPLAVLIHINLTPPESWPKWKKEAAHKKQILPTSRPDLDNYLKAILDAGTGHLWYDDSQIVQINASLEYAPHNSILIGVENWETFSFKSKMLYRSLLSSAESTVGSPARTLTGNQISQLRSMKNISPKQRKSASPSTK